MAKKRTAASARPKPLTPERLQRLYRLLQLLGDKPLKRDTLESRLKVGMRKFYRDLEALRDLKIEVQLKNERYALAERFETALARLPFPDPGLTVAEAMQLSKGKGAAQKKLREKIKAFTG